jgi:hypothetical protein
MAIQNTSGLDKTILAYCLRDVDSLLHCISNITSEYFVLEYRGTYNTMVQYHKRYKQIITVDIFVAQLRKKEIAEDKFRWYEQLLTELSEQEIDIARFKFFFDEFQSGYFDGVLREALEGDPSDPKNKGVVDLLVKDKNPKGAWARLKKAGVQIESSIKTDYVDRGFFSESVDLRLDRYNKIKSGQVTPYGMLTGFGPLDDAIKGLRGGELLLIGGRPGSGKSVNLVVIAKNIYKGIPGIQEPLNVMLFSLEMPRLQYEQRFDSSYTELPLDHIELGVFTPEEEVIYFNALQEQKQAKNQFYIVDRPGCTPSAIEAELELALQKFTPDVILVDYIGIVQADEDMGRDDLNQGAVAEGLRRIARERRIPIISAVQLNRPDKKRGDTGTHRISRSDIVGQTADVVIQIDDSVDDTGSAGDFMNFIMVKNRKGPLRTFQMYCNFSIMTIKNTADYKPRFQSEQQLLAAQQARRTKQVV